MPIIFSHLSSSHGLLKVLHLVFGGISIILAGVSYVPFWALDVFIFSVSFCLAVSTCLLCAHLFLPKAFTTSKHFSVCSSLYHFISGAALIFAGIDLVGWADYNPTCGIDCPSLYVLGVAKILTFINGTLYATHGFLEARGEEDEDFYEESFPLMSNLHQPHPPPPLSSSNFAQPLPSISINIIN